MAITCCLVLVFAGGASWRAASQTDEPAETSSAGAAGAPLQPFVPPVRGEIQYTDCPLVGRTWTVWTGTYGDKRSGAACEGTGGHPGVDILPGTGDDTIHAMGTGTVVKRNDALGTAWGRYVVLRHAHVFYPGCSDCTVYSVYAHLRRIAPHVTAGGPVERDQRIGIMGTSGTVRVHLHFQVQLDWNGVPFWPTYTGSGGEAIFYPSGIGVDPWTGQRCIAPRTKMPSWCDTLILTDAQRQEAAEGVRANTVNPMWLVENGGYSEAPAAGRAARD